MSIHYAPESKYVEIRDHGTCIPALALRISGRNGWLARRAGFGETPCVYLLTLATEKANYDPFHWDNSTMRDAHLWLVDHFDEHEDGDVLDVRYVRGERPAPVESDFYTERSL